MMDHQDHIRIERLPGGVVELCLDRADGEVNQLDRGTLTQLRVVLERIGSEPGLAGVLVTSRKEGFMVGADLSEFRRLFSLPRAALSAELRAMNRALVALEDLDVPTVAALNGYALGGGLELALAASLRVLSAETKVGLPEVTLGLIPAFGGVGRLARIAGASAPDWILSGRQYDAAAALAAGVADEISPSAELRERALDLLHRAAAGQVPWRTRQEDKRQPVRWQEPASPRVREVLERMLRAAPSTGGNPAAMVAAGEVLEQGKGLHRDQTLELEADAFAELANTQASAALIQTFLNRRALRRRMRALALAAPRLDGVVATRQPKSLGLALASVRRGMRVCVLEGTVPTEADLTLRVAAEVGLEPPAAATALQALAACDPLTGGKAPARVVLDEAGADDGEHGAVGPRTELCQQGVLLRLSVSQPLRADASAHENPAQLVGLNIFGPVERAELVELVRAPSTSDEAIAMAVRYTRALGKTAIIVAAGHSSAVAPALAQHLRAAFRMAASGLGAARVDVALRSNGWARGAFELWHELRGDAGLCRQLARYGFVPAGDPPTEASASSPVSDGDIAQHLALSLALACCGVMESGAVGLADELDVAVSLNVGFPADLGGPLQYLDWLGAARAAALGQGKGLPIPALLLRMAQDGQTFFHPN